MQGAWDDYMAQFRCVSICAVEGQLHRSGVFKPCTLQRNNWPLASSWGIAPKPWNILPDKSVFAYPEASGHPRWPVLTVGFVMEPWAYQQGQSRPHSMPTSWFVSSRVTAPPLFTSSTAGRSKCCPQTPQAPEPKLVPSVSGPCCTRLLPLLILICNLFCNRLYP